MHLRERVTLAVCACVSWLAFGCGAPPDADDIGATSEAITVPTRSGNLGFGVTDSSAHLRCTTNNYGQACLIPMQIGGRRLRTCIAAETMPSSYVSAVQAAISSIASQAVSVWDVSSYVGTSSSCADDKDSGAADAQVNAGFSCGGRCRANTSIEGCVCVNPTVDSYLSESLPGTYSRMLGGIIHIDTSAIQSSGLSSAQQTAVLKHGIAHQAAVLMGIGGYNHPSGAPPSDAISDRRALPYGSGAVFASDELCQLSSFIPLNPTTFAYSGNCP